MANITTTNSTVPSPHTEAHTHHSEISPLALVALVMAPIILYALVVTLMRKWPGSPFQRSSTTSCKTDNSELICTLKYTKEAEGNSDECPVCLSVFVEGEEIRQLSACKHVFHVGCIDMWLCSHSNCPVCRASAGPVKRMTRVVVSDRVDDFHQGLPGAAGLV